MTRPRSQPPLAAYVVLFMACVALFAASVSCNRTQRIDTLRASLVAVNAARDGFATWDRDHQQQLVAKATSRAGAEADLEAYRASRARVVLGFEVTYRSLAVAATQVDEPSLKAALTGAADLVDSVKKLIGGP